MKTYSFCEANVFANIHEVNDYTIFSFALFISKKKSNEKSNKMFYKIKIEIFLIYCIHNILICVGLQVLNGETKDLEF